MAPQDARDSVKFLLDHQRKDGTWPMGFAPYLDPAQGVTVGTTALAALALREHRDLDRQAIDRAVDRAVEACLARVYRKKREADDYESTAWGQIYTLELLARLIPDKKERADSAKEILDWFYARQKPSGAWGYETSFQTAAGLLTLHRLRESGVEVSAPVAARGVAFLKSMRTGLGFRYASGQSVEDQKAKGEARALEDAAGRLAVGELALYRWQASTQEELKTALERFLAHRSFLWEMRERARRGDRRCNSYG
jgi:hypothetical protein